MATTSCDNGLMTLGKRIRKLREQRGMSQQELAELLGTTQQTIAYWESDKRKPRYEKLKKLASIFKVPVSYFLEEEHQPEWDKNASFVRGKVIPIPIYGEAQAGSFGGYTSPTPEQYFPTPDVMLKGLPPERVFWIRVEGDSMRPMFQPGDLVLVADPSWYEVKEGAPVVAVNGDGELTVKYYHHDRKNKVIILEPANPAYKPIVIPENKLHESEVLFFPIIAHTKVF